MQKITRSWLPGAVLLIALCPLIPSSRAQEAGDHMKMSGDSMTKMSPEEMKMAGEHMDKTKMTAAEHPQQTASDMARMMVMDKIAMQMAMDPGFTQMLHQSMSDPNMKKVHEDAGKMAEDPAQMAKIRQQVMDDPTSVEMVMHLARTMATMHDSMMHDNMMHGSMTQEGTMKDSKMKDMPAPKK